MKLKFDRALLEVVAAYLLEKLEESDPQIYQAKSPINCLTLFFKYELHSDIGLFKEFVRKHYECDYVANELRKSVVAKCAYFERRAVLVQVEFFVFKLSNPESSSSNLFF